MAATNTSNVVGLQKEKVLSNLPKLFLMGEDKIFTQIMRNGGLGSVPVSKRSLRIPLQVAPGGKGRIANFDGGTLGRGGSINTVPGFVSTKGFVWALESTTEAYWGTDSSDKAIASLTALEQAQQMENFKQFLDSLLFAANGILGVTTVVSGSGPYVATVANANNFYIGQDVLVYSALGGTNRATGSITVTAVDANNKQVTLTGTLTSFTVGDLLIADGTGGVAGASLSSIYDYHVSANTGTVLTLNRATYSGQLNISAIAAGGALTTVLVRAMLQLSVRKIGTNNAQLLNSLKFIVGVEQAAAWEAAGTSISQIFRPQSGPGLKTFDGLPETTPNTMAGRELITQLHGDPTRVDSILLKNWGLATTKSIGPYSPPGSSQTVFPVVSTTDGSVVASNLKYWALEADVFCINPAQESALTGLTIPTNL
jgi:hypothetical protein